MSYLCSSQAVLMGSSSLHSDRGPHATSFNCFDFPWGPQNSSGFSLDPLHLHNEDIGSRSLKRLEGSAKIFLTSVLSMLCYPEIVTWFHLTAKETGKGVLLYAQGSRKVNLADSWYRLCQSGIYPEERERHFMGKEWESSFGNTRWRVTEWKH